MDGQVLQLLTAILKFVSETFAEPLIGLNELFATFQLTNSESILFKKMTDSSGNIFSRTNDHHFILTLS